MNAHQRTPRRNNFSCLLLVGWVMMLASWPQIVSAQTTVSINVQVKASEVQLQQHLSTPELATTRSAEFPFLAGLVQAICTFAPNHFSETEHPISRWYTLRFSASDTAKLLAELALNGRFDAVELSRTYQLTALNRTNTVTPNDPDFAKQWHHPRIQTLAAWDTTQGDTTVLIGLLDTGIDYGHPELAGQYHLNAGEDKPPLGVFTATDFDGVDNDGNGYVDDVIGYNFVQLYPLATSYAISPNGDVFDDNGHGTVMAGVMVAKTNNQIGIAGIAPKCRLVVLKAFGADGTGDDPAIARAIVYAADNGVRVLNCSFGDIYPSAMMHAAIQYAAQKGLVIISSSGNGTGTQPHYPSDFEEVISVSATDYNPVTEKEFPWSLNTFGPRVSLAAPGNGIYSTAPRDTAGIAQYGTYSGTSISSAIASAAAALVLSHTPTLPAASMRDVLASTADDITPTGYDVQTGAGRLNILRALQLVGAPLVRIESPENDSGSALNTVAIVGTVIHPELVSWSLYWQQGSAIDENAWQALVTNQLDQKDHDTLYRWNLTGLADNTYHLRLSARLGNGKTAESRIRFIRDRTAPSLKVNLAAGIWENGVRKVYIAFRSSDKARHRVFYRPVGTPTWKARTVDRFVKNADILLQPRELSNGDYEYYIESRNAAGLADSTAIGTFSYSAEVIDTNGFVQKPYTLPSGMLLPRMYDLTGTGTRDVVMAPYDSTGTPTLSTFYSFTGGKFTKVGEVPAPPNQLPKSVGDLFGEGNQQLLLNYGDTIWVYGGGGYPTQLRLKDLQKRIYPSRIADLDNDGKLEVIGKNFVEFQVLEQNGQGQLLKVASLRDTAVNYSGSATNVAIADFDGDGKQELATGDFDGKLIIYENTGDNTFAPVFNYRTGLQDAANLLTAGDFDGDGKPELFMATHTSALRNNDFEYGARYWHLYILKATSDNTWQIVWQDYLYNFVSQTLNAAIAANLDTDAAEEIVVAAFPNAYRIEWENGTYRLNWHRFGVVTSSMTAGDFDADGTTELGIGTGSETVFLQASNNPLEPKAVALLSGEVTGPSATLLSWTPALGATRYDVYRGIVQNGSASLARIAQRTTTTYADQGLNLGRTYAYQIVPVNSMPPVVEGKPSNFLLLMPHARPVLDSAQALNSRQLLAHFSHYTEDRAEDLPLFHLNAAQSPATMVKQGPQSLLLTFAEPFLTGVNTLRVDTAWFDQDRAKLSPSGDTASFIYNPTIARRLLLSRWVATGSQTAVLTFSETPTTTAFDVANYTLRPNGQIVSVQPVAGDDRSVQIEVVDARFGALGEPLSVQVSSIESTTGSKIQSGYGDVATFVSYADNLKDVFVYPNPVRPTSNLSGCRFANLTQLAVVRIFSTGGHLIRTLNENDGNGGVEWDLRDQRGGRVSPGVYLYEVEGPNGAKGRGRFTVIP